jgi:SAM-dependent methyltransferase
MTADALAALEHRASYDAVEGRDKWIVRAIGAWMDAQLPVVLAASPAGCVLDAGCGEQPFRAAIAAAGRRCIGMDVVQNRAGSVAIIGALDALPDPWPHAQRKFPVIICTEVLEHVPAVDAAFANLRALSMTGGRVVLTTPFLFPLHMEPYDYRRLTAHGIEQLATAHGFAVERLDPLGTPAQAAATLLADLSIIPPPRAPLARARVALLRTAVRSTIRGLSGSPHGIAVNGHSYLGTAAVLRAE